MFEELRVQRRIKLSLKHICRRCTTQVSVITQVEYGEDVVKDTT